MTPSDFQQDYFQLFGLPKTFALDSSALGERFRQLQRQLHPDLFASKPQYEQRIAVQYSAYVNQAYTTLRKPLSRAFYLLELAGKTAEEVSGEKVDGGFLIEQMDLREKLETIVDLVEPATVLEHLMLEIKDDISVHQQEFTAAFDVNDLSGASSACVKMQYLEKLQLEAEQLESSLLD